MTNAITIQPGQLDFNALKSAINNNLKLKIEPSALSAIDASKKVVDTIVSNGQTVYGINTGFGSLGNKRISSNDLIELQRRIVLSHAAGVGELLSDEVVKIILLLKLNSLAQGFSGVRLETIDALMALYNHHVYPCIPSKGSVGASGDLAPLAHLACALLGEGHVRYQGEIIPAAKGLEIINRKPLVLAPKEGLALLNGTQVSTALAISALLKTMHLLESAILTGCLSVEAAMGSHVPFDERIHQVRGQRGQIAIAKAYRNLLRDSEIARSHIDCDRVQDPYSLRCQPQVMGACLNQIEFVKAILSSESNGVSDNPLVFAEQNEILSGGNFHAEPVAMAADNLAIAIAEIGAIAERRIALLIDKHFSHLPSHLVSDSGLNSGFMMAQVTACALASENKSLAHPASVDSMPTNANQEDHVSMATFAARRLHEMIENVETILAIELLCACQGLDFRKPLKTSPGLAEIHALVRQQIPSYEQDRYMAPDIVLAKKLLAEGIAKSLVSYETITVDLA